MKELKSNFIIKNLQNIKKPRWIILILLIIFVLILHYLYVNEMVSLPSPLYGGDYYYQLGAINHIKDGGNPLSSTAVNGELPTYLPVYSFLVGNFARLFNLESINAMFILSYFFICISTSIIYLLSYNLFRNYFLSVISSLFFIINSMTIPLTKYTDFGTMVMMPLFIYLLYNLIKDFSFRNSIFLGLSYGIIGLTHQIAFISSSLLLVAFFIYYLIIKNFDINKKSFNFKESNDNILKFMIILVLGIPIALLWWYHPIFTFHGKTSVFHNTGQVSFDLVHQFSFLWGFIKNTFLRFNNLTNALTSILSLFALVGLKLIKTKKREIEFVAFLFISSIIIVFHYFITENLFGFYLFPSYMISIFFKLVLTLFFTFGCLVFINTLSKFKIKKFFLCGLIILLLLISIFSAYKDRDLNNTWRVNSKNPLPAHLVSLKDYLTKNSEVYDVVLTTKEVGFAVNAVTGRKLVSYRRGHSSVYPFITSDTRELDQAIIFYGKNIEYKKELFKKYNVTYLYWDYYWIQSEYTFDDKGKMVGRFDPLLMYYSEEREGTLKENGVKYFVEDSWVDATIRGNNIPKSKIIFISPENYNSSTHPWNPNIDPFLKEIWSYSSSNSQKIAILYEIVNI